MNTKVHTPSVAAVKPASSMDVARPSHAAAKSKKRIVIGVVAAAAVHESRVDPMAALRAE